MEQPLTKNIDVERGPLDLAGYEQAGGYAAARKALSTMTPGEVTELVKSADLKGRGGAGFSAGLKWSFVPMGDDAPSPKYLVCNADEMEPGTFKDRVLMEGDPHLLVESMIIAAYAIQAEVGFIFLRWAYKLSERVLRDAMAEARAKGYLGDNIFGSGFNFDLHIHSSAGRYMCGEETGLLNALEGRRATPRAKPPFPQISGLWGKPTIVQNVETLCNVPPIIANGAQWFKDLGKTEESGTKLYGVSGRVKRPGTWELPIGTSIREIIEEHAGGMQDGYAFRGLLPGGASTDFLVEEHLDVPMDFGSIAKAGSRMGTGTMIILDDQSCPVAMSGQPADVLRPRVLRLVHAVPRRPALDRTNPTVDRQRRRPAGGSRVVAQAHQIPRARAHVLCPGAGSHGTTAECAEVLRGRFRATHH